MRDLSGQIFGKLQVIQFAGIIKGHAYWKCRCFCTKEVIREGSSIFLGKVRSCNCLRLEVSKTHGFSSHPLYHIVQGQWHRCNISTYRDFDDYGGRGIIFNFPGETKKEKIIAAIHYIETHLGPRPSLKHTVDRINNDGHYEPGNLRWATKKEQMANRRERKKQEGSSKYKGISWSKRTRKWIIRKTVNNKRVYIGTRENEEEAKKLYDMTGVNTQPCT